MRSIRKYLCHSILALLTSTGCVNGATTTYQGSSLGTAYVSLGGSLGSQDVNFSNVANPGILNTTLNTQTLQLTYNSVSIVTGVATGGLNAIVTTGFGQTSNIVATVNFNPFSYSLSNFGTVSLTPSTGGNFTLGSFTGIGTLNFSGSYSITDGVNAYNGNFSTPITASYQVNEYNSDILYADQYPASIRISGIGVSTFRFINYPSNAILFSQQFGSNNVKVTIETMVVQTGNSVTLSVPEPSTCGLIALGLSGLGLKRRRTRVRDEMIAGTN